MSQVEPDTSRQSWMFQRRSSDQVPPLCGVLELVEHRAHHELGDGQAVDVGIGDPDPLVHQRPNTGSS